MPKGAFVCVCVCLCVCPKTKRDGLRRLRPAVGPLPFTRDDRRATGRWLRETGERRRRVRSAVPGPCVGWGLPVAVHAMNEHLEMGDHERRHCRGRASTHLAMKRRHGDRRRLLARDSNHDQGQRPGSSPAGCDASRVNRREPPVVRGKTNDNPPGRQIVPYHRALTPPRNTP